VAHTQLPLVSWFGLAPACSLVASVVGVWSAGNLFGCNTGSLLAWTVYWCCQHGCCCFRGPSMMPTCANLVAGTVGLGALVVVLCGASLPASALAVGWVRCCWAIIPPGCGSGACGWRHALWPAVGTSSLSFPDCPLGLCGKGRSRSALSLHGSACLMPLCGAFSLPPCCLLLLSRVASQLGFLSHPYFMGGRSPWCVRCAACMSGASWPCA
jgi:hypothetical protein